MLTNAVNRSTPDELNDSIVSQLVPGLLQVSVNVFALLLGNVWRLMQVNVLGLL